MTRSASPKSKTSAAVALWQSAAAFAAYKHRHQLRKDARTPYFSHTARVAMTVACVFGCTDPVALAAAYLHDTIEDTTTDYDDLAREFGEEVAACVAALSKNMAMPEPVREPEYYARLAAGPWQSRLVKLADVFDNVCDLAMYPEAERAKQTRKSVARARHAVDLARGDVRHPEAGPVFKAALASVERLLKSA